MRDPKRIPVMVEALRAAWLAHPDLRLGQLVGSAAGSADPFYIEDDVTLDGLRRIADLSKPPETTMKGET